MVKLIWKVGEKPTGAYRSFQKRGWPTAYWPDGEMTGFIFSDKSYTPKLAREGQNLNLEVWVKFPKGPNRRLKARASTLKEAKELLEAFIERNSNV